jgi:hypothetical protein
LPDEPVNPPSPHLAEFAELLIHVDRATALRPEAERHNYEKAQDSVVEARRVAEARAGSFRISR